MGNYKNFLLGIPFPILVVVAAGRSPLFNG
jgi:hypothetical protein